jgi:hypothetical protein
MHAPQPERLKRRVNDLENNMFNIFGGLAFLKQ